MNNPVLQTALNTTRAKPQITSQSGRYVYLDKEPPGTVVDTLAKHGITCTAFGWDCRCGYYLVILADGQTETR